MSVLHPLLEGVPKAAIESEASHHLGRTWVADAFTDLADRASHPCGLLHGQLFSVFAKLSLDPTAGDEFRAQLDGLTLLRQQDVFDAYREISVLDPGFAERRELWRIFAYLAVVTVDGDKPFGRRILARLADAVRGYC